MKVPEIRQWCKFRSNDRHALREMGLVLDRFGISWNYAKDDERYPPTLFAWCERSLFDRILETYFGIHRR